MAIEAMTLLREPRAPTRSQAQPRATCRRLASYVTCIVLLFFSLILLEQNAIAVGLATNGTNSTITQQQQSTTPANFTSKTTERTKTTGSSNLSEPQQIQSTDVSSTYVQIPLAIDGQSSSDSPDSLQDQQQQHLSVDAPEVSGGSKSRDSAKWTGPWPKKFRIGYIKQSDLHQVLIDSLKSGEPFVGPTFVQGPSASATGSSEGLGKGAIGSGSLTGIPNVKTSTSGSDLGVNERPSIGSGHIPRPIKHQGVAKNMGSIYNMRPAMVQSQGLFTRDLRYQNPGSRVRPLQQQQQQRHMPFQTGSRSLLQGPGQPMSYGPPRSLGMATGRRLPAGLMIGENNNNLGGNFGSGHYQFSELPMSFKNQPMYTINNQDQLELGQMHMSAMGGGRQQQQQQLQQMANVGSQKPGPKIEYYSSWRPVGTGSELGEPQVGRPSGGSGGGYGQQADTNQMVSSDGFDDGFGSGATKEAGASAGTMNRHPALSGHLSTLGIAPEAGSSDSSSLGAGKVSPVRVGAARMRQQAGATKGTKSATGSGATKSTGEGARSAGSGSNTSDSQGESSSTVSPSQQTTASSGQTEEAASTTPPSAVLSSTPQSSATLPGTQAPATGSGLATTTQSSAEAAETQDPDTEVIESEPTTEAAPAAPASGAPPPTTTTTTSSSTTTTPAPAPAPAEATAEPAGSSDSPVGSTVSFTSETETTPTPMSAGAPAKGAPESEQAGEPGELGGTSGTTSGTTSTSSSSREETTPSSPTTAFATAATPTPAPAPESASSAGTAASLNGGGEVEGVAGAMSDEALQAAALRSAAEINKSSGDRPGPSARQRELSAARAATKGGQRSSERLLQASASRKSAVKGSAASKGRQSARAAKQLTSGPAPAPKSSPRAKKLRGAAETKGKPQSDTKGKRASLRAAPSTSRSIGSQTSKLQKSMQLTSQSQSSNERPKRMDSNLGPQVVSMSAAQAQSTAQTLASLLLARCLSSANCNSLLEVCATKQAQVQLQSAELDGSTSAQTGSGLGTNSSELLSAAAWSTPTGLMSSGLMGLLRALQADKLFKLLPQWREAAENLIDHDVQTGYTLIVPSNEAVERLSSSALSSMLTNNDQLAQLIDAHILDSAQKMELGQTGSGPRTRLIPSKGLQINEHRDKMLTINGRRVVYANQLAPGGGRIHVIDGFLESSGNGGSGANRLLDIMDTLKQCDKFDGFVTLAEGTGLTSILKQDGPVTVFVPSNEALRKIPDDELEVIKNNSTALKEFLMYHVVNGSYFSQDLRDGQQLTSILDDKPIQVGVRVDGCSRRLVEANTSPMRRPDIVAKNGVIHILDWYLTVKDNEWCDSSLSSSRQQQQQPTPSSSTASNVDLSGINSVSSSTSVSERLQQAASDSAPALIHSSLHNHNNNNNNNMSQQKQQLSDRLHQSTRIIPANHKMLLIQASQASLPPTQSLSSEQTNLDNEPKSSQSSSSPSRLLSSSSSSLSSSLPSTPSASSLLTDTETREAYETLVVPSMQISDVSRLIPAN